MKFVVDENTKLYIGNNYYDGVKRIAGYISSDIQKVFGCEARIIEDKELIDENTVIIETLDLLSDDQLANGAGDLMFCDKNVINAIAGKREVYSFSMKNQNLVITGSDKRGTIYGMFHLSELMGVSPLVNWGEVKPLKKKEVILTDEDMIISKEPSVKFRGFFINDEWPAFGNWCTKRFGGFNAECYERVFELLLRFKGNYLWPGLHSLIWMDRELKMQD